MIKIDPGKHKKISFKVDVEGIDPQVLEYHLRLSNGKIDYGFKGTSNNGSISFELPPLSEVVNRDTIESLNEIKLEVNDRDNKYYLKPFQDTLKIDKQLKVEAKISEDTEVNEKKEFKVSASISEEEEIKPEKKKKTKLGKFLTEEV